LIVDGLTKKVRASVISGFNAVQLTMDASSCIP